MEHELDERGIILVQSFQPPAKEASSEYGAESYLFSTIYLGNPAFAKVRLPKKYRAKALDDMLRRTRTAQEARLLIAAKKARVRTPRLWDVSLKDCYLVIEALHGSLVKEIVAGYVGSRELNGREAPSLVSSSQLCKLMRRVGELIGKLHVAGITHGDLTTSNLMLTEQEELAVFDFGLGKFSAELEDHAVDLLVFHKCLQSSHVEVTEEAWSAVELGYGQTVGDQRAASVEKRINEVLDRRRHTPH